LVLFKLNYIKNIFFFFLSKLSSLGSIKYRESIYIDKRTNKTYKSLNFWTKSLPELTELYNVFYIDKVKVVPKDLSLLSPANVMGNTFNGCKLSNSGDS
jgi:hypothetical protein